MRRTLVRLATLVLSLVLIASGRIPGPAAQTVATSPQLDILILHGTLVDGAGRKPRNADVGNRQESTRAPVNILTSLRERTCRRR